MKKFVLAVMAVSLVVCGVCVSRKVKEARFDITGTVEVPQRLLEVAQADNNSCAIIIKNEADVPVAIKRVVNPKFPLAFELKEEDLLASEVEGNLKLEVQINSHGKLGVIKEGDIFGAAESMVHPNSKDVLVQADKMTGMPRLARSTRGNFFRTAAR